MQMTQPYMISTDLNSTKHLGEDLLIVDSQWFVGKLDPDEVKNF